jgi:hypothetical protein
MFYGTLHFLPEAIGIWILKAYADFGNMKCKIPTVKSRSA